MDNLLISRYNPRDHRFIIFQRLIYACLINCAPLEPDNPENGVVMLLTDVSEENRIRKELSELNLSLEEMAHIDSLTKIANRRKFDTVLKREWQRSERTNSPLSLILLDVDFFKRYNDRYGHQMEDTCLQRVARTIAETLNRSGDLVCRFGGEEFAVILYGQTMEVFRINNERSFVFLLINFNSLCMVGI